MEEFRKPEVGELLWVSGYSIRTDQHENSTLIVEIDIYGANLSLSKFEKPLEEMKKLTWYGKKKQYELQAKGSDGVSGGR